MSDTLVVSGCDDHHHGLAADLIASLNATRDGSFDIGFVNIDDGAQIKATERSFAALRMTSYLNDFDAGALKGSGEPAGCSPGSEDENIVIRGAHDLRAQG